MRKIRKNVNFPGKQFLSGGSGKITHYIPSGFSGEAVGKPFLQVGRSSKIVLNLNCKNGNFKNF